MTYDPPVTDLTQFQLVENRTARFTAPGSCDL